MKTIEHYTETHHLAEEKARWRHGPWTDEADRFEGRVDGFPVLGLRHPQSGHWCGYVGVPPGHPWHGSSGDGYSEGNNAGPRCHGGVTFAEPCADGAEGSPRAVCHVPRPGEPAEVWWLGFDCCHYGDCSPGYDADLCRAGIGRSWSVYRDLEYVKREVASMARQASEAQR